MELLSSIKNKKLSEYLKLSASPSRRRESGLFVLEGLRLCSDSLRFGCKIKRLFFTRKAFEKNEKELSALISAAEESFEISESLSRRLSDTQSPQGIFCIACRESRDGEEINTQGKYLLLDNIQDPANLGTIARTAEALGLSGLILAEGCSPFCQKAMRASMGALLSFNIIQAGADASRLLCELKANGMRLLAAVPDRAAEDIREVDFRGTAGGTVVVIGNEARGVSEELRNCCDAEFTIKMPGRGESLNAAAAAAIIMWEMVMRGK